MHISLTPELEHMVKDRIESGMYNNASEVMREALRKFFDISQESIDREFIQQIREIVTPRMEAIKNGNAQTQDFELAFDEIEDQVFGS